MTHERDIKKTDTGLDVPAQTHVMKKMRNFMESLARRKNMDPLLPETWHNIPYEAIYQYRVCSLH